MKKILIDNKSLDLFQHLAFEKYCLSEINHDFFLIYLWQSSPSVVIGKHQNPWIESDPIYLEENSIKLGRRITGGGAVYHDPGNINISFISSKKHYSPENNLEIIRSMLEKQNIQTIIKDFNIFTRDYKISGSAFFLNKKNAVHHCTLLVRSDLAKLRKSLAGYENIINGNSVRSNRMPVINLADVNKNITPGRVKKLLASQILDFFGSDTIFLKNKYMPGTDFDDYYREFVSPRWIYKKNRPFQIILNNKKWNNARITINIMENRVEHIDISCFASIDSKILKKILKLKNRPVKELFQFYRESPVFK